MKQHDTTNPASHRRLRSLLGDAPGTRQLELSSRFRILLIGLYYAEPGKEWDSKGCQESDFLHHVDLVCSGHRQVVHAGTVTELEPGWAWFLPGCTPVERRCAEQCRVYFIKFRCEWLPGVDPLLDWPQRRPLRLGRWEEREFRATWQPGQHPDLRSLLRLQGQLYHWLADALPSVEDIIIEHVRSHGRFEPVFDLIEGQLGADLRVEQLARCMSLSQHAFSMAFSRSVGVSPRAYLNRRLSQEAIKLLLCSEASVKEVAYKLKFEDEHYFSRFFKKLNGVPPLRYRQELRPA